MSRDKNVRVYTRLDFEGLWEEFCSVVVVTLEVVIHLKKHIICREQKCRIAQLNVLNYGNEKLC